MKSLGRREFLRLFALAGTSALAAACAPQVVEKIVKETVVVEKEVVKEVPKEVVVKQTVVVAGTPKTVEKVVTTTPAPKLSGEVAMWVYPFTENDMEIVYDPLNALFNQEYPDIKMNVDVQPWGGRREKLYAAFAANEAPDLWYANADTLPAYLDKGVALDLNEVLSPDDLAPHDETALSVGVYRGKRLFFTCFPFMQGEVVYNGTLMTECGVDPEVGVTTWQDLYDLGEKAKAKGWYARHLSTTDWQSWVVHVHSAGGQIFSDYGTKADMLQQAVVDSLTHYVKMYENEWVPLEYAVGSDEAGTQFTNYFQERLQVLGQANEKDCDIYLRQWPDFPWVVGKPTHRRAGDPLTSGGYSGSGWAIVSKAKNMQQAVTWVKWCIKPENLGLLCTLTTSLAPAGDAWKYLKLPDCVSEFAQKLHPFGFTNSDQQTLWQQSKIICAPQFQGAVLGQLTVDEALQGCQTEMQKTLDETLAAST